MCWANSRRSRRECATWKISVTARRLVRRRKRGGSPKYARCYVCHSVTAGRAENSDLKKRGEHDLSQVWRSLRAVRRGVQPAEAAKPARAVQSSPPTVIFEEDPKQEQYNSYNSSSCSQYTVPCLVIINRHYRGNEHVITFETAWNVPDFRYPRSCCVPWAHSKHTQSLTYHS